MVCVKICGIRSIEDAELAIDAGADLLGFNLIPSSVRHVSVERAQWIVARVRALGHRTELVGVVADRTARQLEELLTATGLDSLQLHGNETPAFVASLGIEASRVYKAVRIADASDVNAARRYPGSRLLVDAKVPGQLGGTGQRFDWELVRELAKDRELVLAGGLKPANVAEAVRALHPHAVDVASGVESEPGVKSAELIRRFIAEARAA